MSNRYRDASLSPEERTEDLLAQMTLDEKLAQLQCHFFAHGDLQKDTRYGIGQISTLEFRQALSLEEAAGIQREIQETVMKNSRFGIPAVFHMEGLCGALVQDATSFPAGIGRGASFDPALEEKISEIVSRQERALGITQILAPVLDINREPRMGREGETYGEDSTLAAAMGSAYTRGVQKQGEGECRAESVAKHYMGFHQSEGGIHGTVCSIPERLLREVYGLPFQAAIAEENLRGVMPCYCSIGGEPVSASEHLLTQILRQEMGFDGVAVADYSAASNVHHTQKLYETEAEAGLACLSAGMDVELPDTVCFNEEMKAMFAQGKADMALLDQAVRRVLRAKFRMGLFEHPFALTGSALFYYQQALDCALADKDSSLIGALYHDFAMVYNEKKDYILANQYVSKAIMIQGEGAVNACLSKAQIMLNLNQLDSASYFYNKNMSQLDIYGKAVCYDGMYQIAKKKGEWKVATENMDIYKVLYDSIQIMTDNEELNRLMDKH